MLERFRQKQSPLLASRHSDSMNQGALCDSLNRLPQISANRIEEGASGEQFHYPLRT